MTKQRDLKLHHQNLLEVRDIMNSMKTLAYMETRKLENYLPPQQAIVENVKIVADDFLLSFPQFTAHPLHASASKNAVADVLLLLGSERGFCADYNHRLIDHYLQLIQATAPSITLSVGARLNVALQEHAIETIAFSGASVWEEVESVLLTLVDKILALQDQQPGVKVNVLYNGDGGVREQALVPPFENLPQAPMQKIDPLIYMDKEHFLVHLSAHYVYAKILEILYNALMFENQLRVSHLQSALNRLDESLEQLQKRINTQRQEEIIEEIEVILLNNYS